MPLIDDDVLTLAAEGDGDAFQTLVNRYKPLLLRLLWRMLKDRDDVLDVLQETFIRAWGGLPEFRGESEFETWITRIAMNCAADRQRVNERHAHLSIAGDGVESPEPYGDRLVHSSEIRRIGARAIRQMTEVERIAYASRYQEGMPYARVGGILGVSEDAARQTYYRATRKLRTALKDAR